MKTNRNYEKVSRYIVAGLLAIPIVLANVQSAVAAEDRVISPLWPVLVDESYLIRLGQDEQGETDTFRVVAKATYANACLASTRVVKKVSQAEDSGFDYELLQYNPSDIQCTQLYDPFIREWVVDQFSWPRTRVLPEVRVNGGSARLQ